MSSPATDNGLLQFWQKDRWAKGLTPWHLAEAHAHLTSFHDRLTQEGKKPHESQVLVPLCGKSVDMIWLWQRGYTVVGIDGVEIAATAFRDENNLPLTKSVNADGLPTYSTEDGKLSLVIGDFLNCQLFNSLANKFDAVWDRAALVAIEPDRRPSYKNTISKLLRTEGFRYLLSTFEYDQSSEYTPPPHSVNLETIKSLYSDLGSIEQLTHDPLKPDLGAGRLFKSGIAAFTGLYLISK